MSRVVLGRLGVKRVGPRIVKLSVGQVRKKRQSGNYCPNPETTVQNPETTVQIRKLLSRSGNRGQNRKHRLDPGTGNRKLGRRRVRKKKSRPATRSNELPTVQRRKYTRGINKRSGRATKVTATKVTGEDSTVT